MLCQYSKYNPFVFCSCAVRCIYIYRSPFHLYMSDFWLAVGFFPLPQINRLPMGCTAHRHI